MKFHLLCLCSIIALLCLFSLQSNAQTGSQPQYFLPQPFPRSPNATAFEKYGSYQVNEFTGIPDISIPLYTIEAGGFKIPITLSYHASGIKVTDVASWAGLGWSVSAGGQISRKTIGLPDDDVYGYLKGYMWAPSAITTSTLAGVQYLEYASNGTYDTKPDIYSYDFPGHSGKFFFDGSPGQNFAPRFVPFAPLKLTHTPSNGTTTFSITDEHGDIYNYGGIGYTETTFSETGGTNSRSTVSAWKISGMISQNRRDTVSFTYQTDTANYPSADAEIFTVIDQVSIGNPYGNAGYTGAPATPGIINETSEELPQQVIFKNGKVVFESDNTRRTDIPGTRRLKDIKVYRYNYGTRQMELQRTIMFYHGYFFSGGSYRLRLDSVQIQDKAGSVMQHYRFGYNRSVALPGYTSKAQDFWGYYNGCDGSGGKNNNTMLTPKQTVTYNPTATGTPNYVTIGQADRRPDSNYMQAYVLDTIKYPTGGYSTFSYQTNQYDTTGVLALAGGLRIRAISSYDGVNPVPIVKTYVYNSARANFFFNYAYFVAQQTHREYTSSGTMSFPTLVGTEVVRSYSSNPHCDLEAFDAANVVYPSVTEYIGTPGENIGRTDYIFSDKPDGNITAPIAGSQAYYSYFYARGHLISKKEYLHLSNGNYQPVQLTTNTYSAFPEKYYPYVGLIVERLNYNDGPLGANPFPPGMASPDDANSFFHNNYAIYSDDNYLTSTAAKVYDGNDTTKFTTSTTQYVYNDTTHMQLVRTYHTDSKGNTHVTTNKYAFNYPAGNAVIDSMVSRHMYAEVIEKYDTLKNAATGVNAITSGQLNQFKYGYIPFTIVPSKISTLSVMQPLTNFTPSTVSAGNLTADSRYVQMISFDQYDGQNNPIQYTPRNSTPTSIIWDYQSEYPVAQVKNATNSYPYTTQVAYTSFEADGNGNWSFGGTPVFNSTAPSGSMVYSLSLGSISLNTSLDNTKTYVLSYWSNNGAATVYAGSYLTGAPMTTNNGWTYYEYTIPSGVAAVTISGSTTIDELRLYPVSAQMTTYAYDPNGVVDISDTKGMNTSFEYDFAQRLKTTRDFYGNITASYGYHMYDQTVGNQVQTATITRNNCPPNTTPGSLIYSVPANKYYGTSLASANLDAVYDLNTNGQAKANTNCGCPQIMVNFTLSNTSGYSGYQATFSGIATPYNFPASGSTVIQVPQGTYATVSVSPSSTSHTFSLTGFSDQTGHSATFNNVTITTGSNLTLSAKP